MKLFIFLIIVQSFVSLSIFGQKQGQERLDSLIREFRIIRNNDTTKVNLLNNIAYEYYSKNPDKGIEYGKKGLKLANDIKFKSGLANSNRVLGISYWVKSDYPKALEYYFQSMKICEEINDEQGIAGNLGNIGLIYSSLSDYNKALNYFQKALNIYLKLNDKSGIANNYGNIGNSYQLKLNYDKALEYHIKALEINKEMGNRKGIAINLGNIGSVYQYKRIYPEAIKYQFQALKINMELNRKRGAMFNLGNIGEIYLNMSNDSSLNDRKNDNKIQKIDKQNYLLKSIDFTFKALNLAKETGSNIEQSGWFSNLSEAYKGLQNWKLAYLYADSGRKMVDSIFSNKSKIKIASLELKQERELKEKEIEQKKIIIFYTITLLILTVLLTFFIYTRFRIKKKTNKLLENKNSQISEQNTQIKHQNEKLNHAYNTIELLSNIGLDITSNLTVEKIIDTVYDNVKFLMNSTVFGIGIYNEQMNRLYFIGAKESGETLPEFSFELTDNNRLAVYCFNNQQEIMILNYKEEATKYIKEIAEPVAGKNTESLLYCPLNTKVKKIGVISVQSFERNVYSEYHLNILRNLSNYVAIALDNAEAYLQIEKQNIDIAGKNEILNNQSHDITLKNKQLQILNDSKDKYLKILNSDLLLASDYVKSIIPEHFHNNGIAISWIYKPFSGVGGDALGFHWIDDSNLAVYLIDVSGHGVGAALHSISILNSIKNETLPAVDFRKPEEVLGKLNEIYKMENYYDKYFTMWYGVFSLNNHILKYSGAGHPYPLLINQNDDVLLINSNVFIGCLEQFDFTSSQIEIPDYSTLYVFSDGVYEIQKHNGSYLQIDDFYGILKKNITDDDSDIKLLYDKALEIRGRDRLDDDFTIIKVKFDY